MPEEIELTIECTEYWIARYREKAIAAHSLANLLEALWIARVKEFSHA